MMRRLLTCALLGFCLHLNGCGSGVKKCRCGRRLETGRMLSSRRRRTFVDSAEYSEVCCDDWDPGSTDTDTDDTYDDYWYSDEAQEKFDNALAAISRRRYVVRTTTESMTESNMTESNTTESTTAESNTTESIAITTTITTTGPSAQDAALLRRAFEALAKDPSRPGARDELEDAEEALTKVSMPAPDDKIVGGFAWPERRLALQSMTAQARNPKRAGRTMSNCNYLGKGLGVNPLVLNFRGNALSQLGRFREALQDYREATEIFRKDGGQYKDQDWVKDIRRWPPQLVKKLNRFLRRETA
eukprot:Skav222735  [mRNA]  locus=scaffold2390:329045:334406:+ [translate_table: standard]